MKITDTDAGAMTVAPRRSCNRHYDCDAADARQAERRAAKLAEVEAAQAEDAAKRLPSWDSTRPRFPLPAWRYVEDMRERADHCSDEGCSDCFGN